MGLSAGSVLMGRCEAMGAAKRQARDTAMVGGPANARAPLPALAFGARQAPEFRDPGPFAQELLTSWGASVHYEPKDAFRARFAVVEMRKASVFCAATSAVEFRNVNLSAGVVLIPIHGTTRFRFGRNVLDWEQGRSAVFLPPIESRGECTARSFIGIKTDARQLRITAATMLGERAADDREIRLDLDRPRCLDLQVGRLHFEQLYRQYMAVIDGLACNGAWASNAGVDDMILRTTLMLIAPDLFFPDQECVTFDKRKLSVVFDYVDAHLAQRITLSDLESVSGLSARSLQYAFQSTIGTSPMQWVVSRRLEMVHKRLSSAVAGDTVTSLASEYFANLGGFSRLYRERFGEYPSQTLQGVQAKPLRS